jgi:hypothetical protein
MTRIKILGLCLVAGFVIGGVGVTSAAAFTEERPEYGRCLKIAGGGKWKDGGCKKPSAPGEEKFEWYPGFGPNGKGEEKLAVKLKFKSKSEASTTIELQTVSGTKVVCKEQTAEGEITGPKTSVTKNLALKECTMSGEKCKSTNPAATSEGEILVNDLNGLIGLETSTKVAKLFVPTVGEVFTEFKCSSASFVVKNNTPLGGVMSRPAVNSMKLAHKMKFTQVSGKQAPQKFLADAPGTKRVLFQNVNGGLFEQTGLTLKTIDTYEEKLETSSVN